MCGDQALEGRCEPRCLLCACGRFKCAGDEESKDEGMKNERMKVWGVPWLRGDGKLLMVHAPIVFIMPAYSDG
jgi:hypothetical protein